MRNDGYGSYQARRDLLSQVFDPLYMRLLRLEEGTFEALLDPVSPRAEVGWPAVDEGGPTPGSWTRGLITQRLGA